MMKIEYDFYLSKKIMSLLFLYLSEYIDETNWISDPFSGSVTTGIAANLSGRRFLVLKKN